MDVDGKEREREGEGISGCQWMIMVECVSVILGAVFFETMCTPARIIRKSKYYKFINSAPMLAGLRPPVPRGTRTDNTAPGVDPRIVQYSLH